MSAEAVLEILERAVQDAKFRALLARSPGEALSDYELTAEERAAFRGGALRAEALAERISKTDLSAMTMTKTVSPAVKPPSAFTKPPRTPRR